MGAERQPRTERPQPSAHEEIKRVRRDLLTSDIDAASASSARTGTMVVGAVDDAYEREAHETASRVVATLNRDTGAQRRAAHRAPRTAQRSPSAAVVGAAGGAVDGDTDQRIRRARGGGAALDPTTRTSMEQAMGADFSGVRVHSGGESRTLNERLGAEAFTVGSDVFFRGSTPDVSRPEGQELLAHELTHTMQQGGAHRTTVQRKMWDKKKFLKQTYEGALTKKSEAQKVLEDLIDQYLAGPEEHGVVLPGDEAKAVNLLLQMQRAVEIWISDHTVDVDNGLGGVDTIEDPSRKRRMAGMKEFRSFLTNEVHTLQRAQETSGAEITTEMTGKSAKLIKYEEKKQQASSIFENLGFILDKVVSDDGDSTEVEIEIKLPIDPSGVGFIGGRFKAEVAKDDGYVKARCELAVTGGANISFAEVKAEIGGYLEAQAANGKDVMALVSYALYRRFRESNSIPAEASNFLWGGNWGDYGKGKADTWSREMEKRMFTVPEPDSKDFESQFPKDPVKAKAAYDKAVLEAEKQRAAIREKVYVESGGLVGVSATLDGGVIEGKVSAQYTQGTKIDLTSLENRKGGAGEANLRSSGVGAKMAGALTGGTRGAEKKVGRTVHSFSLSSGLSGGIPGFTKLSGSSSLNLGWESDGKSVTRTGQKPVTSLTKNELKFEIGAEIPFSSLGPGVGKLTDWMSDKMIEFIRKAVEKGNSEANGKKNDPDAEAKKEAMKAAKDYYAVMGALKEASEGAKEKAEESSGLSSSTTLKATMTLDGMKPGIQGSIDFSKVKEAELELKVLEAKMKRSKRILKISKGDSGWTVS